MSIIPAARADEERRGSSFPLVAKLRTWQRSFCAGNGAERHRLPPLGKLRALSLSKRQAARRVAVATASNLSFVVRGGTAWSQCGGA